MAVMSTGSQTLTKTSRPSQAAVPADTPVTAVAAPSAEDINNVPLTEEERRKLRAQRFGGSVGGPLGKVTARNNSFLAPSSYLEEFWMEVLPFAGNSFSSVTTHWLLLATHQRCSRGCDVLQCGLSMMTIASCSSYLVAAAIQATRDLVIPEL